MVGRQRQGEGGLGAQVNWAVGPGRDAVDNVFAGSGELPGDAVVVFLRSLCAVSMEELIPSDINEPPRFDPPLLHELEHECCFFCSPDDFFATFSFSAIVWGDFFPTSLLGHLAMFFPYNLHAHINSTSCQEFPLCLPLVQPSCHLFTSRLASNGPQNFGERNQETWLDA